MENVLRDGLCCVGLFYLLLHLWDSLRRIRNVVTRSSTPHVEDLQDRRPCMPGPRAESTADDRPHIPEEASHVRFDRS